MEVFYVYLYEIFIMFIYVIKNSSKHKHISEVMKFYLSPKYSN